MSELVAKPIVKNKFWVVEDSGQKIATIQATDSGGYVYVHDEQREHFPSVKNLKQKYHIRFSTLKPTVKKSVTNDVYGYPVSGKAYNQVYDVTRRIPLYSKTLKSKSLFCAGYYLIKYNASWTAAYCPKNITISRYEFIGPFKTEDEMNLKLKRLSYATN